MIESDHRTFDDNLQRFVEFQRTNAICQNFIKQIDGAANFEEFMAASQGSRGSMVGSGRFVYPRDINGRLYLQTRLLGEIADGKIDANTLFVDFFYVSARLDDNLESFLRQFFRPYIRDFRNRLSPPIPATPPAPTPTSRPDPTVVLADIKVEGAATASAHPTVTPAPTPTPTPTPTPSPTPSPPPVGAGRNFSRNAEGDEVVLDVDVYADVIADLLAAADRKDLCFAILGAWGRGKTFLADQIVKSIERNADPKKPAYEVVRFQAWKYPSRPEVWVYLYETIRGKMESRGWWQSIATVIRTGINRHGVSTLVALWAAMLLTVLPKGWLFEAVGKYGKYLWALNRGLAVMSLIFAALFLLKFWKTKAVLERDFLRPARHSDKLGLQATIGEHLTALFKGWIGLPSSKFRWVPTEWRCWECAWGAVLLLVLIIRWRAGGAEILGVIFALAVFVPVFVARLAFATSPPSPDRLLLIVDDLDRCQADHLLTVMESIKLLLEEPEVSRRVQVLMVVQEDVLRHALDEKYSKLLKPKGQAGQTTDYDSRRVVRDNIEKFFTAYFRLPPLTDQEVGSVVRAFGATGSNSGGGAVTDTQTTTELSGVASDADGGDAKGSLGAKENVPLTSGEKDMVLAVLLKAKASKQVELGPRAVRGFMFRYQLARLILEAFGDRSWTPETLATAIANIQVGQEAAPSPNEPLVTMVARQVA